MAKNYLFAPFKDDEDKINVFNHLIGYLPKGHRNDLIMFIGRLESYYDVIIEELQADKEELQADKEELQADKKLVHAHDVDALLGERNAEYYELLGKYNKLQADITHDAKVCYDVDDEHIKIIDELKAENKKLNKKLNDCSNVAYVEILERGYKKEIESLQDQLKDAVNDYESLLNSKGVK